MNDSTARATHQPAAGFTLVEVLGAVAILGLSYIMLATAAISGLRMIGESQRRIQASLLADRTLAEIEIAAAVGQAIDIGYEEGMEQEPFTVDLEILDMAEKYAGEASGEEPEDLLAFLSAEASGPFAEFRETNLLLGFLREVHVTVRWQDGANEIEVTRTAFIYDQRASIDQQADQQAKRDQEAQLRDDGKDDTGASP